MIKDTFFSTSKLIFWHNSSLLSIMKKILFLFNTLILLSITNCQTIKNKSDEVAEKENQKFGQYVGKQVEELKMELGAPTDDFVNDQGNETLVYKTKKYGIPCERKFIINTNGTITGFTSSGCI